VLSLTFVTERAVDVAFFASLEELRCRAARAVNESIELRASKGELSASGPRPMGPAGLKCPVCGSVT
jgi:hypothetical protein